ncbi:TIGR02281 family clan AA aspartic protease [Neorhizobium sp. T786]|uniref:TIGR02281 family clan AA aspartic protease n=1 Tax=Pseudorhizobium xiangyangii TaxID=2883104 RepID=UPI001CFF9EEE|nr:TIGR02281 family clan AA aspartic protease [Neorhizobium xiangyangii]MCB5201629.1 TIGR02281 family clan AA aspartic protease [Neorhizobium xiangyangii]
MLMRSLLFAAVAAVVASQIPALIGLTDITPDAAPSTQAVVAVPEPAALTPRSAVLRADGRGHFNASFRINGKPVEGLVDTGASLVALNESTARRLGFSANRLDFRHSVSTANGKTEAAHVVLDRMEIGGVQVRDVDAFVLRDRALDGTLVGMSFLKKLAAFKVEDGTMRLEQ